MKTRQLEEIKKEANRRFSVGFILDEYCVIERLTKIEKKCHYCTKDFDNAVEKREAKVREYILKKEKEMRDALSPMKTRLLKRLRREARRVKFVLKDNRTLSIYINREFGYTLYLNEDFSENTYVPKEKVLGCQRRYIMNKVLRMKYDRRERERKSAINRLNRQEW